MAITKRPLDHQAVSPYRRGEYRHYERRHLPIATSVPTDAGARVQNREAVISTVTTTPPQSRQEHLAIHPSSLSLSLLLLPLPLPTPAPERTPAPLEALPKEIIDEISKYLPYETLIAMKKCSRLLYKKVDRLLALYESKVWIVLHAELKLAKHHRDFYSDTRLYSSASIPNHSSGNDGDRDDDIEKGYHNFKESDMDRRNDDFDNYGCYFCIRVMRASRFGDMNPDRLINTHLPINMRRFCILCGVQEGIYKPGDSIDPLVGHRLWVCNCRRVRPEVPYHCCVCKAHTPFRPNVATEQGSQFILPYIQDSATSYR